MDSRREQSRLAVRKHKPDYMIVLLTGLLLLTGLILIFALSPGLSKLHGGAVGEQYYTIRQLIAIGIGIGAFIGAMLVPFRFWLKSVPVMLGVTALVCLLIAIPGSPFRVTALGATRWFAIGSFSFQPAELIKFSVLMYAAQFLANRQKQGKLNDTQETLIPFGVMTGVIAFIVVILQKDMGSMMVLLAMLGSMLYIAGVRLKTLGYIVVSLTVPIMLAIVLAPHRISRLTTFLNPDRDCQGAGWHICQSLIAVGSGGVFGVGLGKSVQAAGYLPEAANDSIFSIFAEKFGFIGSVVLLVMFAVLILRIIKVADKTLNPTARLVATGIFAWLTAHVLINIGAMLSLMPLKGITLPLISSGGTSIIFIMAALGVVFHISRYTSHQPVDTLNTDAGRRPVMRSSYSSYTPVHKKRRG